MLDLDSGGQIEALYVLTRIKGGISTEKFRSKDITDVLKYQKWYSKRYREGLLLEIHPTKIIYDNISKKIITKFD